MATTLAPTWDETTEIPSWDETTPAEEAASPFTVPQLASRALVGTRPIQFTPAAEPGFTPEQPVAPPPFTEEVPVAAKMASDVLNTPLSSYLPQPIQKTIVTSPLATALRFVPSKTAKGISEGLDNLAAGLTSPLGIAMMGTAGLPRLVQRGIALAFAGQMASQTPEIAKALGDEFGRPADERDTKKIAQLITEAAGTAGLVTLLAKHGLTPEQIKPEFKVPVAPETTIEKGVPNASQVTSPEGIPGPQVRAGMDETTPLRQPGETPGTRPPEPEAQAAGIPEALAEPSPVEKLAAEIAFQKPKAPTTLADIESGKAVGTESAMAALVDELRQTKDPVSVIQKWAEARDKASAESAAAAKAGETAKDVTTAVRKINGASLKSQLMTEAIQNIAQFGEKEFSPETIAAAKQHFNKGSTLKPPEIPNVPEPQPQVPQAQTPPPQLPRPEPAVAVKSSVAIPEAGKDSVTIRVKHSSGEPPYGAGIIQVTGKPVKIPSAPPEFDYVAYKTESGFWKVVEKSTGLTIGNVREKTLKKAIERAEKISSAVRPDAFRSAVNDAEKLNPAPVEPPAPTPAAAKVEAPDMGIPTLKNPIKAFGKSYYKNASGEWRQKGKPSATVNVSTRNALDEILNPPSSVSGSVPAEVAQGSVSLGTQKLMPAPGAGNVLTPKSQRQIITDLAKGLKLPIRFGRLTTTKYAGYFKPLANLIGSKRANDVPTVSHEVGHKLDALFSLSGDKTIAAELDRLGDPATPGSMSSWTPTKTKKYKIAEGLAEFVRHWITDPARAAKESPNTHRAFEAIMDANKDVGDVMRRAQEDVQLWRTAQPQARLRSQISIGDNPNKTPYTLSQLTRDLVDDLHIMRLAVDDAKVNAGKELPPSQNPYLLARNLRGSYGMAETFIRNGTADFATRKVELGKSFEDALKPVAGRINDFRDWIVAKRAKELMRQGRETGLVESDVDAVIARFEKDPAFQKAFDSVKQWNAAVLKYAVDSGLLSPDSAAAMSKLNQDYVPFHRLFEVGAGESPSQAPAGIGQGLNVGKPGSLKRLRGSPRQIVDPLETMIKNAYTIITASEKAAINQAVADMANLPNMGKWIERIAQPKENIRLEIDDIKRQLEKYGADLSGVPDDLIVSVFRASGRVPFGENIIRVVQKGEHKFYRLNKELHDTFQALDLEDSGKLIRFLSAPAQLLRAGVVLEPSFNLANAMRDTFSSAVINKYGAKPFETTIRGLAAMLKNPQLVAEWAASGGKSSVEANFFDRTKLQRYLTERVTKDLTPAERALVIVKSPLTALRWLTGTFEEATRIGEYQIAYDNLVKSGMPEGEARRLAAFEARDRQDFAKGGAKTKIIRHMAAFWNANLQANVKLAQSFKQRPVRTILQGLTYVTTAKLIEQAINWNDSDYWDRQQWERDLFFLIPIGKDDTGHTRFIRVPTPFEVGLIFGTLPGRVLQWAKTNRLEEMADFPAQVLKQTVPNPIPQTLQVVFEDFLSGKKGWDIFRGREIVPERIADLPPELQWTEQTSSTAKLLGRLLHFSPMKIDHIIQSTTGGMGKLLSGRQIPGQRFVTAPLPYSNQASQDFYDILDSLEAEASRNKATGSGGVPENLGYFRSISRQLSQLRNQARQSGDDSEKARLGNKIFQLQKDAIERFRNPQGAQTLNIDTSKLPL